MKFLGDIEVLPMCAVPFVHLLVAGWCSYFGRYRLLSQSWHTSMFHFIWNRRWCIHIILAWKFIKAHKGIYIYICYWFGRYCGRNSNIQNNAIELMRFLEAEATATFWQLVPFSVISLLSLRFIVFSMQVILWGKYCRYTKVGMKLLYLTWLALDLRSRKRSRIVI